MRKIQSDKCETIPLSKLRQWRNELAVQINNLNAIISAIEKGPRREIDIADEHTGDPALIAYAVLLGGDKEKGSWRQRERIYCSLEKCPSCPHGEYFYAYRRNKKRGTVTVKFCEEAVFKLEDIENAINPNWKPSLDLTYFAKLFENIEQIEITEQKEKK